MTALAAHAAVSPRRDLDQRLRDEAGVAAVYPQSYQQERLFFLDRLEPGLPLYNVPAVYRVDDSVDVRLIARVLQEIVRRHESLRTTFVAVGRRTFQVVRQPFEIPIAAATARTAAEASRVLTAHAMEPFDLRHGPLLRAILVRGPQSRAYLGVTMHHIVGDGWSSFIFLREMAAISEAFAIGAASPLQPLPIQYGDYAKRQRAETPRLETSLSYWREQLEGLPTISGIPTDHPRAAAPSYRGALKTSTVPPATAAALFEFGRSVGATPFMTTLAAFAVLLHRWAGERDVVVGSPVANRTLPHVADLIGFFVNTLVLRIDTAGTPTFRELLGRVRATCLGAYDNQDVPFERVVEALQPPRDPSHNPLFQVLFSMQGALGLDRSVASAGGGDPVGPRAEFAKFDLSLFAQEAAGGLALVYEYATDLYDTSTINRLDRHFQSLCRQLAEDPNRPIINYHIVSKAEARTLRALSRGPLVHGAPRDIVASVVQQAAGTPDLPAIVDERGVTDYGTLLFRARRLALRLDRHGVTAGDRVGILSTRGSEAIVRILAVLLVGAAYVPLDPAYPPRRLRLMAGDAAVRLVAGDVELARELGLDPESLLGAEEPSDSPISVAPDRVGPLGYVMFTSGSTGRPKGVEMWRSGLSSLLRWQTATDEDRPFRTLQFTTLSFDVSFQEIFATLATGGTLYVPPDRVRRDFERLWDYCARHRIERLFMPSAALSSLAQASLDRALNPDLRLMITAGEQLYVTPALREMARRHPGLEIRNQYGPTETHVVTELRMVGDPGSWPIRPSIGSPVPGMTVEVREQSGRQAAIGTVGEIWVRGPQVASGYFGQPTLSAERFVAVNSMGLRHLEYRTGDRARLLRDGAIEFLGRSDAQIKIRGVRVEPGEIEAELVAHPDLVAAAVTAIQTEAGPLRLLAHVQVRSNSAITAKGLRAWLEERLPDVLVPSQIVVVDALPFTPSGKVDLRSLAMATPEEPASSPERTTGSSVEQALLRLVADLLERSDISIDDDFFAIGGHSLLVMQLVARIRDELAVEIPLKEVFKRPRLRDVAAKVAFEIEQADRDPGQQA